MLLFSRQVVSDSATPWTEARQASLSITNSRSLLKLISIESVRPSNHLILSSPFPPALNLSQGLLQWGRSSHQVPKVLELQLQDQPFRWIFRVDLLAVQGTLESLLQHHSSEASILWHSAFFVIKLSYPHMTTGKSTALTICTFVGKVMSLLFDMLSSFVLDGAQPISSFWMFWRGDSFFRTPNWEWQTDATYDLYIWFGKGLWVAGGTAVDCFKKENGQDTKEKCIPDKHLGLGLQF